MVKPVVVHNKNGIEISVNRAPPVPPCLSDAQAAAVKTVLRPSAAQKMPDGFPPAEILANFLQIPPRLDHRTLEQRLISKHTVQEPTFLDRICALFDRLFSCFRTPPPPIPAKSAFAVIEQLKAACDNKVLMAAQEQMRANLRIRPIREAPPPPDVVDKYLIENLRKHVFPEEPFDPGAVVFTLPPEIPSEKVRIAKYI
jgi:hypothetical protein